MWKEKMTLILVEEEKRMSFVVFLDVDGVLNTRTSCVRTPSEALKQYDIEVLGSTKERWGSQREEGIKDYLEENPEIEEYVILDDNQYGFDDYTKMWERFLDTKGKGIENATYASQYPAVETMLFMDAIKERS